MVPKVTPASNIHLLLGDVMRTMFRVPSVLAMLAFLLSCSTSSVFVLPEYVDKKIDKGSLAVLILDKRPVIHYSGDLKPEFGEGNPQELILDFFATQLPIDIKARTTLKDVKVVNSDASQPVSYTGGEIEVWENGEVFKTKATKMIKIPMKGQKYQFDGFNPEFVLIIDNLSIVTQLNVSAPMMGANGMMMGGSSSKTLNYVSDFALWDNGKENLISMGHLEKEAQNLFPVITMSTWKSVSSYYVEGIFSKSPFMKYEY